LSVKINVAARLTNQAARIRLGDLGAWPGQIPILLWLLEEDGIIQKELVELVNMEQPTVAEHLERMERSGLIFRERDSEDRRSYRIFLTDHARSISAGVLEELESGARLFMQGISKSDMATFQAVMSKIISNLHDFIQDSTLKDRLVPASGLPATASLGKHVDSVPRKRRALSKVPRTSR
jgi:DNA-binding MarR family transcriptional regulator